MSSFKTYIVEFETRYQTTLEVQAEDAKGAERQARAIARTGEGTNVFINEPELIGVVEV